jgi:hypothetical protein
MMRFTLGFFAGLGAAWAALAIWQRVPPFGPVDPSDEAWPPAVSVDGEAFERAADANQLVYRSQHAAGLGAVRRHDYSRDSEGN